MTCPPRNRYQLILCDGPRCCRDPNFVGLRTTAAQLASESPERLEVTSYPCLGRCGVGPNLLVRRVPELGAGEPGYRDLDGTDYYYSINSAHLLCIIESYFRTDAAPEGWGEVF